MLQEMKANNYQWENYTKEGLTSLQQEKKEIEEEEAFIKLLQNMLQAQIENIKMKRQNLGKKPEESLLQEQISDAPDFGFVEDSGSMRPVGELVSLAGYFKSKLSRQKQREDSLGPIAQCQQQRCYNTKAMQFYLTTSIVVMVSFSLIAV